MNDLNFSEDEEKSLIGILYNHISFATTMEVFGELDQNGKQRLNALRSLFAKLLEKYSLIEKLTQEDYLLLGLGALLKKESLEKWLNNENNKHLQNRAKYFSSEL